MTIRGTLSCVIICCASAGLQGCAPQTCERLCLWFEDVDQEREQEPWDECQEVCEQDYSQASNDCRSALRDMSKCVDGLSSEAAWTECSSEIEHADEQCACSVDECTDDCADEYFLRLRIPTCNAINATEPTG